MTLFQGKELFKKITAKRVLALYPNLLKKLNRYYKPNYGSSQLDQFVTDQLFQVVAPDDYRSFVKHYGSFTSVLNPMIRRFGFSLTEKITIEQIVKVLESYRKFKLTAKKIIPVSELKNGDVLYSGQQVIVDRAIAYTYNPEPKEIELDWFYVVYPIGDWIQYACVVGSIEPVDIHKMMADKLNSIQADTVEEWMSTIKYLYNAFPSIVWHGGKEVEGIGSEMHRRLDEKYQKWYFENRNKVIKYYQQKADKDGKLNIDFPQSIQEEILERLKENSMNRMIVQYKGIYYEMIQMVTFIDSPIKRMIQEDPDDPRIKQIIVGFRFASLYNQGVLIPDSDIISDGYKQVEQLSLF